MFVTLMGADSEPESTIKVKLWPVISLLIAGLVGLAIYAAGHESRLCVVEKSAISVENRIANIETQVKQIADDQNLYYSIREPRWEEWKKWNEKKNGNGKGK